MNDGLVFTTWGLGRFLLWLQAGKVFNLTQNFNFAYYGPAALLMLAAGLPFLRRAPQPVRPAPEAARRAEVPPQT